MDSQNPSEGGSPLEEEQDGSEPARATDSAQPDSSLRSTSSRRGSSRRRRSRRSSSAPTEHAPELVDAQVKEMLKAEERNRSINRRRRAKIVRSAMKLRPVVKKMDRAQRRAYRRRTMAMQRLRLAVGISFWSVIAVICLFEMMVFMGFVEQPWGLLQSAWHSVTGGSTTVAVTEKNQRTPEEIERGLAAVESFAESQEGKPALEMVAQQAAILENPEQALDDARQQLAIIEQRYGPEHPSAANVLAAMGAACVAMRDYPRAEDYLRRSLAIMDKHLSPTDPSHITAKQNVADVCRYQNRFDEAITYYQEALAARQAAGQEVAAAQTHFDIAYCRIRMNRPAEALPHYEAGLASLEKIAGPRHPEVAKATRLLAMLHFNLGNREPALSYFERTLSIYRQAGDQAGIEQTLVYLAAFYFSGRDYDQTSKYLEEALELNRQRYGADHPRNAVILVHLAQLHLARKDYEQAEKAFQGSLAIVEKATGPFSVHTATVLRQYADGMEQASQPQVAAAIRQRLETINRQFPTTLDAARPKTLERMLDNPGDRRDSRTPNADSPDQPQEPPDAP